MKINFEELYNSLEQEKYNTQKLIKLDNCVLRVYYGLNPNGKLRLSFISKCQTGRVAQTKAIAVVQGTSNDHDNWTCFDLMDTSAKQVFYALCNDLIKIISCCKTEQEAITSMLNRFYAWKKMFKGQSQLSEEKIKGLFGEMYYLLEYMIPKYGVHQAICSWSGIDGLSKDFSINDNWYEIKTISANRSAVKISSITQLSSETEGELCVVKVEKMYQEFSNGKSSLKELFDCIMDNIEDNELVEVFVSKLSNFGYDMSDTMNQHKYRVDNVASYLVKEDFPRIMEGEIKYSEITNVTYELQLPAIEKFKI